MYAYKLDSEILARFLKQRQEGRTIILRESYKLGQSLAEVIRDSCSLSNMPLSVYLKAFRAKF